MSQYKQALELLETVDEKAGARTTLERVEKAARLFGNPELKPIIVHVTGSNGKGSVCAFTASILQKAGFKVGLYTSPYIFKPVEKIKINGKDIGEEAYGKLILEVAEKAGKAGEQLSYSDLNTIAAFVHFARNNADFAVMEVKAGGRFDATNICKAKVGVITNVSLEHQKLLGKTRKEIAFQKAGIIKQGMALITAEKSGKLLELFERECGKKNARLAVVQEEKMQELGLNGSFQKLNAACAAQAARALGIREEFIAEGLKSAEWPCRFQIVRKNPLLLADSAHNHVGVKSLVQSLRKEFPGRKFNFVVAFTKGKKFKKMLELIAPLSSMIIAGKSDNKRAVPVEKIMKYARKLAEVQEFKGRKELKSEDTVVCGSIFFMENFFTPKEIFGSKKRWAHS